MKPAPIRLTITARDEEEAQRILAAVARARRAEPAAEAPEEILVTPHNEPPLGHTYRELRTARLAGRLEATMTRKGLVITRAALDAYRARRSQKKARPDDVAPVADLTERRIRALENADIPIRRRR